MFKMIGMNKFKKNIFLVSQAVINYKNIQENDLIFNTYFALL